ncbi:RES family NAD+ phosphorylase [Pseudomonas peli]|uniref:RES family NAD+ phosphorylase n=1 Tax=Pseudomonas peli TaxID=592361 RepID=UPI0024AD2828|nr:RES family NAD+ phosphorylase [Pseudomonas peli]
MRFRTKQLLQQTLLEIENSHKLYVCQQCLDDPILKRLQPMLIAEKICVGCNQLTRTAITPERIANFVRKYLPNHFIVDYGLHPGFEMTLPDVVSKAIGCKNRLVCEAIADCMVDPGANEEEFYWPGQEYCLAPSPFDSEEHERWYVVGEWDNIAHELTHGRRFFNEKARKFFESLLSEALNAEDTEHPGAPAVIKSLPVGSVVYRARIANDHLEAAKFAKKPADELGAPPKTHAANNRMSPAGVPLLYVASNIETCIAEVRPSIGDLVVVGGFSSTAPLKLFDFTALDSRLAHAPLSFFSPSFQMRSEHRRLLEYLHDEIARPVRAYGTDYVVTQALAEFIRYNEQQAFDGIMFRSVQCEGGVNYVLFDKGPLESMQAPDWHPRFELDISADTATIHHIRAVRYEATNA